MKIKEFFIVKNATKKSDINDIIYKTNTEDFVNIIRGYKKHPSDDNLSLYTGSNGTIDSKSESEALEDANKRLAKSKGVSEPKHDRGRPKKVQEAKKVQENQSIKRGRGRPKKVQEAKKVQENQSIKRGRGRPKKVQENQSIKHSPGRPKGSKTAKEPSKMKELSNIRKEIESEFMFHVPSYKIRSPGKFEGEMIYMPYYYGLYLEGGSDDSDENIIKVEITPGDRIIFPELPKHKKYIKFIITDQGFVQQV